MKRIAFLCMIFLSFTVSKGWSQIFGVEGGINLSNQVWEDYYLVYDSELRHMPGFNIAFNIENYVYDYVSIETGLRFQTKGLRVKDEFGSYSEKLFTTMYYIGVPLVVKGSYEFKDKYRAFIRLGTYFDIGLVGRYREVYSNGDREVYTDKIYWGNDEEDDEFRRFDSGLTLGGGIEINSLVIGVAHDFGLANISSYQDDGFRIRNRVVRITIGYKFNSRS
ncbi:MAG: PorT family protein [Saprospiraceae bacterium]|nr:PorT family protein [Saprospiraceae bacterium]